MAAAKWSVGQAQASTDAAGTTTLSVPVLDSGVKQADITFTLTAGRVLTVWWHPAPGAQALSDFRAWQG